MRKNPPYLMNYQEGYARAIAETFGFNLRRIQLQLDRLERGGILVSRTISRVRLYRLNPKWYFHKELAALIGKALSTLSGEEREKYFVQRSLPRVKRERAVAITRETTISELAVLVSEKLREKGLSVMEQALLVANEHPVSLSKIKNWSAAEKMTQKYSEFERRLRALKRSNLKK